MVRWLIDPLDLLAKEWRPRLTRAKLYRVLGRQGHRSPPRRRPAASVIVHAAEYARAPVTEGAHGHRRGDGSANARDHHASLFGNVTRRPASLFCPIRLGLHDEHGAALVSCDRESAICGGDLGDSRTRPPSAFDTSCHRAARPGTEAGCLWAAAKGSAALRCSQSWRGDLVGFFRPVSSTYLVPRNYVINQAPSLPGKWRARRRFESLRPSVFIYESAKALRRRSVNFVFVYVPHPRHPMPAQRRSLVCHSAGTGKGPDVGLQMSRSAGRGAGRSFSAGWTAVQKQA